MPASSRAWSWATRVTPDAARAGAGGAPDAVHVVLARGGNVVVDDVRDARHVDPARGDVGGHERVDHARLEVASARSR